jgi:hypothetical protein
METATRAHDHAGSASSSLGASAVDSLCPRDTASGHTPALAARRKAHKSPISVKPAVRLTSASVHYSKVIDELLDPIPPIHRGNRGRPRFRPEEMHAGTAL